VPAASGGAAHALADDAARERIRRDLDATLFVEAGAGTGKTSALVGRIVELVRSGRTELANVAAITFTEAAAAELRERVHDQIAELAAADPGDERLAAALLQVDEAVMTTIHAFAQRILADHPLEAGLPLRLRVLDEIDASIEFERRFAGLLDQLGAESPTTSLLVAARAIDLRADSLRELARGFDESWDAYVPGPGLGRAGRAARPGIEALPARVEEWADRLDQAIGEAVACRHCCRDPGDRLLAVIDRLAAERVTIAAATDWVDRLRRLLALKVGAALVGTRAAWTGCDVDEARAAVAACREVREAAKVELVDLVLVALGERLAAEAVAAADRRRAAGELRFHDLLVHARDLLARDQHVRRGLAERYRYILVDEFQDTDPIQFEIVQLLGARSPGGPLEPGKLFFVGDPKQSIYRFRGADVRRYEAARAAVAGGEPTRLVANFRSVPGVIAWVNAVFGPLLGGSDPAPDGRGGADGRNAEGRVAPGGAVATAPGAAPSPTYAALAPARGPLAPGAAVVVLGGPSEGPELAGERRGREADAIAATVAEAVGEGWTVEADGGSRPARYGDIAVLVPRRTGLAELEQALDAADVPYRVSSTTLVYQSPEVRDLVACLRAMRSPSDGPAVVAALRTPYFGCGDDELLTWRRAGGSLRLDAEFPAGAGAEHPVARALGALGRFGVVCRAAGPVAALEALVRDRHVLQLAAGRRRNREALRRVRFVLDQARAFVEAGRTSVSELLVWMDLQAADQVRTVELPPPEDDEDAVEIMTIHGAKGLEFPIAVMAELGGRPRAAAGRPTVLATGAGGFEIHVNKERRTLGFADLAEQEQLLERAEQLRLCYVAATRARDHLVVALHHSPSASPRAASLAQLLHEASAGWPALWRPGSGTRPAAPTPDRRSRPAGVPGDDGAPARGGGPGATAADYARWLAGHEALVARLQVPASVSATELTGELAPGPGRAGAGRAGAGRAGTEPPGEAGDDPAPWRGRRAATALGRAVHAVLQRVDLATGARLEELAATAAAEEGCAERLAEVVELAAAALSAPVVAAAAASPTLRRELAVAVPLGDGVVDGIVDCCFDDGDGLVLVDYKTDALARPEDVPAAAERYRLQVGAYALALGEVLGRPVSRCVLVFLAPPSGAVELEVGRLDEAVADARRAILGRLAPA